MLKSLSLSLSLSRKGGEAKSLEFARGVCSQCVRLFRHRAFVVRCRLPAVIGVSDMLQDAMHSAYEHIITQEPGKRGGRPCIRGMRVTVADILGWLAAGMSHDEIIADFPELTEEDIRAALAYAADRERRIVTAVA